VPTLEKERQKTTNSIMEIRQKAQATGDTLEVLL
jgi:hypothetical protein